MPTLIIKTGNEIFEGRFPIHAIMADEMQINPCDIIDKGIMLEDRIVWAGSNELSFHAERKGGERHDHDSKSAGS